MILVRHPFERVVSAYNDKMTIHSTGFSANYYEPISRNIYQNYKQFRANVTERGVVGDATATFEDFANYLVRFKSPSKMDSHWQPYEQ